MQHEDDESAHQAERATKQINSDSVLPRIVNEMALTHEPGSKPKMISVQAGNKLDEGGSADDAESFLFQFNAPN